MLSLIFLELTFRDIISDIPMDAGAFIVYALVAGLIGFVWSGSRGKGSASPSAGRPRDRSHV